MSTTSTAQDTLQSLLRLTTSAPLQRAKLSIPNPDHTPRQRWLWPARIPLPAVTLIAGPPGLGKSLLTLDIASRLSRQGTFPDGQPSWTFPAGSLLLSGEDYPHTQRSRLRALGADMDKVRILEGIEESGLTQRFDLSRHLNAISSLLDTHRDIRLLVIDPLPAFTGSLDTHNPKAARRTIDALNGLARRHGLAILAVTHLSKAAGYKGLQRVLGA